MASAGGNRLAAARLMKVAAASRLPPATTRSQSSYTTLGDTTFKPPRQPLPITDILGSYDKT